MNNKKTNRIVAILDLIHIIAFLIFSFSHNYLMSTILTGIGYGKSVYNNYLLEVFLNNINICMPILYIGIAIINIICAFQNKNDKKLLFWQLSFGVLSCYIGIATILDINYDIDEDIINVVDKIFYCIIPLILAVINIILIKKHKPRVIEIISYVVAIILSILGFFRETPNYMLVFSAIMQLIYVSNQNSDVEETNKRKIINIILYYILQFILSVGFLALILISLLNTKINDVKYSKELKKLYENITNLQGTDNEKLYIPVENNGKYGFITEDGKEKISCQYDRVTYFNSIEINGNKYYITLAENDNTIYIISKDNEKIKLDDYMQKYMNTIIKYTENIAKSSSSSTFDYDKRDGYLVRSEFYLAIVLKKDNEDAKLETQASEILNNSDSTDDKVKLSLKNSSYVCKNQNYTMLIQPLSGVESEDSDSVDSYNNSSSYGEKYKVTIIKGNGERKSNIVYLPDINEEKLTLNTFTDGYIEFESEDEKKVGWYNENGDTITLSSKYSILDIKDSKIILQFSSDEQQDDEEEPNYIFLVLDMNGNELLRTSAFSYYDSFYLVKNQKNKMVVLDKNLNVLSNEYDRIFASYREDFDNLYSSYYQK